MTRASTTKSTLALILPIAWLIGVFATFLASHNATQNEWIVSSSACTPVLATSAPRTYAYQCQGRQYTINPSDDWPSDWAIDQKERLATIWCPASPTLLFRPWCAITRGPISLHQ